MNNKDLFKELGNIEDSLISEAETYKKAFNFKTPRKVIVLAAVLALFISFSSIAFAFSYVQTKENELYIRYLTPVEINLPEQIGKQYEKFDAETFFKVLKTDNTYAQYIAINRLVECFNNEKLRGTAINEIRPFLNNSEPKISDASEFIIDILSKTYSDERLYKLADGSIIFTLFNDYSDYGSHNELWQIKDGKLNKYLSLSSPSSYITKILLSPDKTKLAVGTGSNKSSYLIIVDPINGFVSHELVGSARIIYGARKSYEVLQRIDNETYSGMDNISWENDELLSFDAHLPYNNGEIVESVSVKYDLSKKTFDMRKIIE